jgi:hypothetical protein
MEVLQGQAARGCSWPALVDPSLDGVSIGNPVRTAGTGSIPRGLYRTPCAGAFPAWARCRGGAGATAPFGYSANAIPARCGQYPMGALTTPIQCRAESREGRKATKTGIPGWMRARSLPVLRSLNKALPATVSRAGEAKPVTALSNKQQSDPLLVNNKAIPSFVFHRFSEAATGRRSLRTASVKRSPPNSR